MVGEILDIVLGNYLMIKLMLHLKMGVGYENYNMEEKIEINDGHYLELMDRLHVIMCTLNDHCVEHPLAQSDEEIKFKIEYALGQLWDVYQMVGNKSL